MLSVRRDVFALPPFAEEKENDARGCVAPGSSRQRRPVFFVFSAKLSLEAVDASSAPSPSACAASLTSPSDAVLVAELERLVQPLGPLLLEALKTPLKLALPWRCSASACSVFEEAKQPALPTGEVDVHQRLLDGVRGIRLLLSAAGAIPVAACREARALPLLVAALSVPSKALMVRSLSASLNRVISVCTPLPLPPSSRGFSFPSEGLI